MGRPPLPDPRQGHLTFRANRAEVKTIRAAAKKVGLGLGEYIRLKLLEG